MEIKDLKVESARVKVSNANEVDAKYRISADFATRNSVLVRIESGNVNLAEGGNSVASFYKDIEPGNSFTITYLGEAAKDESMQCEINALINDYIAIAETKAFQEANEK